uniref:NADH dehydrogenase subunit 3 n=1 Tax=Arion flagellus TaxID=236857 RepID=UPI002410B15D|nr:NADH dehydrogenase subunit 3 [Arion flagellus]WES82240.1 NADH dehydrogenase subunit 3 [Arion flagellus]
MMNIYIMSFSISALLLTVNFLTSFMVYSNTNQKLSSFECGFDPMSYPRKPFSTRYFMLILIFLVFDVEAVLLLPILSKMMISSTPLLYISLGTFLMILLFGLLLEWYQGALEWY